MSLNETMVQTSLDGNQFVAFAEMQASATKNSQTTPIYLKKAAVGFLALLNSMLANANSVQDLESNGLMALSADMNKLAEQYSSAWMDIMNSPNDTALLQDMAKNPQNVAADYAQLSDLGKLTWDTQNNNSNQALINEDMTKFNADNTSYNQANSFCGGITSGLNSTVSNITNQISEDYQQMQSSTLQIQATIVSVV